MISNFKNRSKILKNPTSSLYRLAGVIAVLGLLVGPGGASAQEDFREGSGLYGNAQCGNLNCDPNEVCQKTFVGFNNNDVLPPNQTPEEVSGENSGGGSGSSEAAPVYDNVKYRCVEPPDIDGPSSDENKYGTSGGGEDYNNADLFSGGQSDPGVPVNIINQDALPVDIFNPRPLPTNIVSPNPIPVTVVDDLALYQQKELVDEPLANKQKTATIGEVNKQIREDVNSQNLVQTPADLKAKGVESGVFDSETGAVPIAQRKYASSSVQPDIESVRQTFQDRQSLYQGNGESLLPDTSFDEVPNCDPSAGDLSEQGLQCTLAALRPENNIFGQTAAVSQLARRKTNIAQESLNQEQQSGDGFLAKSKNGDKNPFTKVISSPGSSIESVVEKTLNSTIDQSIISSDSCFSAIPQTVKDGTLKPLLEDGLFNTSPDVDFNQVFEDIYNELLGAIDCELQNEISSSLEGALSDINGVIFN